MRKKNAFRNIIWGVINRIITIFLPFFLRTLLIKKLGVEYLGLNSLFASILQVLNITELGFSNAIVYCLYKPVSENNISEINALTNFYKNVYRIIGLIILLIGLVLVPFIPYLINGDIPSSVNIYILYLIYLLNTVISYFLFSYRSSIIIANQRNDIVTNVNSILYIIQSIFQIIVLFTLKNYYIYIAICPIITSLCNIVCAIISKKMYPDVKCEGTINSNVKEKLTTKIKGLMIYKICAITRNSFDSIFISMFLGLNVVAIYNNYYLIISSVISFLGIITNSILSGVGNSIASESKDKNYYDMNCLNFYYMLISGWCSVCLLCLFQPFMKIWVGEHLLLNFSSVCLFVIYFYSLEVGAIRAMYADGAGLWWETRYRSILEAVCNIILNYTLGKYFGLNGIIIATLISLLLINFGYGSTIIFKYYFTDKKISDYFIDHLKYFIVTFIVAFVTYCVTNLIHGDNIVFFVVKILICIIIPIIMYYIFYKKNKYLNDINFLIKRRVKK